MIRSAIPAAVRREVLDDVCAYCEELFPTEVDHVIPLSRGGSHDISNFAAACKPCNREKSDLTPEEWKAWRLRGDRPWPPMSRWKVVSQLSNFLDDDTSEQLATLVTDKNEVLFKVMLRIFSEAHAGRGVPLSEEASKLKMILESEGFGT